MSGATGDRRTIGRPACERHVLPLPRRHYGPTERCRSHGRRTPCRYWPKRVCSVAVAYRSTGCRRARVFFVSAAFASAVRASVVFVVVRRSPFSRCPVPFGDLNNIV